MFTKFDEYELNDFFEKKPICIGEYEAGNWIYILEENKFNLVLSIDTYSAIVEISIDYQNNVVYRGGYKDVKEIRKSDNQALRIITKGDIDVILKKGKQIGVIEEPK